MNSPKSKAAGIKEAIEGQARGLTAREMRTFTADAQSVYQLVKYGLANLRTEQADLSRKLPSWTGTTVTRCEMLNEMFMDAAMEVRVSRPEPDTQFAADLQVAASLRKLMLLQAEGAVLAGLISHRELAPILKGRGRIDAARDCVALSTLLKKYAKAIGSRSLVTPAQLEQAREVGDRLMTTIPARSMKRHVGVELRQARERRDRLFTLLWEAHQDLWKVAALTWGKAQVDQFFPDLMSQRHHRSKRKAEVPA